MTRKNSILGALFLSALFVCAYGASSASALTVHECKAAVGTAQGFTSSTCETASAEGAFHTVALSGKQKVTPTLTPTTAGMNVTEGETTGTHVVLHGSFAGIGYQITCTGLTSPNSELENVAGPAVKGTGSTEFTGCTMAKPATCTVPATIKTVGLTQTTKEDKVIFAPTVGTEFVTFEFGGASCPAAFKGSKTLSGKMVALAASPTSLEFTSTSGNELTFAGQPLQFTAVIHYKTADGTLIAYETP
jgi:hypothetical protein